MKHERFMEIGEMKLCDAMQELTPEELHGVLIILTTFHLDVHIKSKGQSEELINFHNIVTANLARITDSKKEKKEASGKESS